MRLPNSSDEDREDDLAFLNVVKYADVEALELLRTNLAFGGLQWMWIALERAVARKKNAERAAPRESSC